MPRERIYTPGHDASDGPPFIEVSWCRHSQDDNHHAQIATLAAGDYEMRIDRPGLYVSLDKDSIDRLIRQLKKARKVLA